MNNNIRNFVIMAHIDHGKSTLADRFLDITKTIDPRKMQPQFLDRMSIERERGITIKMQPVRMDWEGYILNLIDTPGHVDFSYEVSRSLAAVEGAILLVDATQGVQAQTLTNLEFARKENLVIIPVVNKIDLATADVEKTVKEVEKLLNVNREDIILVSGKTGENVEKLLRVVIEKVPSPKLDFDHKSDIPRALIFDSEYDAYKGVVAYVRVFNGSFKKQDRIHLMQVGANAEALELGYFKPDLIENKDLKSGEIGYIATGLKEIERCRVGDTITLQSTSDDSRPLKGYKEPQPVVFASFYPIDSDDYDLLSDGLRKLKLSDSSLSFSPESSGALGRGFRCGFLGMLHLEIVTERLKRDYGLNLITTSPSVIYRKNQEDKIEEPVMDMEIITPNQYLGS
ncbi:MAG: GTP-binding protein, partial [Candidatus Portnoybacteria bacterium]|nr:GTP-binding protein [Candidatus Portnoybacteria bacterium]